MACGRLVVNRKLLAVIGCWGYIFCALQNARVYAQVLQQKYAKFEPTNKSSFGAFYGKPFFTTILTGF